MNLITKIFLKEWFRALLASLIILVLLIVIGDVIDGLLRTKSGFNEIVFNLLTKLPELLAKIFPISTLLASLFAFNSLKTHSELTAVFASGFSFNKVYFVIFISSSIVAAVQFINVSLLWPKANQAKQYSESGDKKKISTTSLKSGKVWFKNKKYFSSFTTFNANTNELTDLTLYLYDKNILTKIIKASKATFTNNTSWLLKPLTVYDELNLKNFSFLKNSDKLMIDLFVSPDDFTNYEAEANTLNIYYLKDYIEKLDKTGINTNKFKVLYFEKFSLTLICIIFALFPLSTIYNPNRRSSSFGKNVVFTLVFTITYWLMYSSTIAMGNSGKIPPALATLILPMFFIGYIIYIYSINKKL